jgi:hypothetical protein
VTYSYGGEDILKLVHESDQARVVHVDAVSLLASHHREGLSWDMCIRIRIGRHNWRCMVGSRIGTVYARAEGFGCVRCCSGC